MAQDKKFIPKDAPLAPAMDFDFLRQEGIRYAQQIAGQNWTDYNDHDPGVTILEQLAYAITELAFRTNLDIRDLLASQDVISEKEQKRVDPLFTAFDILTTNPITFFDLRKLIIDRVKEVDNIWILPLDQQPSDSEIHGNYLALVKTHTSNPAEKEQIAEDVWEQLHRCRNLGELCQEVFLLKEQEVYMKAEIELLPNADVQKVHAEVIFRLEQFLSIPVPFYSLNEMISRNYTTSEIFDSPRLYNGYILDESLKKKQAVINNNELVNAIRGIEGIKSIKYFNILQETVDADGKIVYRDYFDELGGREIRDQLIIDRDKVAVLGKKILQDANHPDLFHYYRDQTHVALFQPEVDRHYKEFRSRVVFRYRKNFEQANDLPLPQGKKRILKDYYSIQNHFPQVYGLGKDGIPASFSDEHKSHIYQLKGYLLLFEQILSDYLMQLSHFTDLFSLDESMDRTYFSQIPWDIPGIHQLLAGVKTSTSPAQTQEDFTAVVSLLQRNMDNFYERRSRFLNHLYARFGDEMDIRFDQFKYYRDTETHQKALLASKIRTLKCYPELTRNKSRSFNPRKAYWNHRNYSTLEHLVRLHLGIDRPASPVAHRLRSHVRFGMNPVRAELSEIIRGHRHLHYLRAGEQSTGIIREQKKYGNLVDPQLIRRIHIDESLFRRGIWEDNLSVLAPIEGQPFGHLLLFRRSSDTHLSQEDWSALLQKSGSPDVSIGNPLRWLVSFAHKPLYFIELETLGQQGAAVKNLWSVLAEYPTSDEAFRAAFALKNQLLRLNQSSESFYVIDHTLLQPRIRKIRYRIQFSNENETISFQLQPTLSFDGIQDNIILQVRKLRKSTLKVVKSKGKFLVAAYSEEAFLGKSLHSFSNPLAAQEEIPMIKEYFLRLTDLDILNEQKVRIDHFRIFPEQEPHDYNFTLSVFLSGWTARFSDPEFRYQTETLFRKYTPAHISIHFRWLELPAMLAFEHLYDLWLTSYRQAEQYHEASRNFPEFDVTEELNKRAYCLLDFIKQKITISSMQDWKQFKEKMSSVL